MRVCEIYTLTDPNTLQVRYVGASFNLNHRRHHHVNPPKKQRTPKDEWARSLRANGQKVIINVIEKCEECVWEEREKYWIKFYRENNSPLLNRASGGRGACGVEHTLSSSLKRCVAMTGREFTQEHRKNLSNGFRKSIENDPSQLEKRRRQAAINRSKVTPEKKKIMLMNRRITKSKASDSKFCIYYKTRKMMKEGMIQRDIASSLGVKFGVILHCVKKYGREKAK